MEHPLASPSSSVHDAPRPADVGLRLQVGVGLALLMGMTAGAGLAIDELQPIDAPPLRTTIDPNVAGWWELAALPGLGEVRARAIVAWRERQADDPDPSFRTAADLDLVHGIGPVTVQRVAAFLHFDEGPADPPPPDHHRPAPR